MLELFQYVTHIQNIISVCEQYNLKNCLEDPCLQDLKLIMQENRTEEDRSKMTPIMASKEMKKVKEILCLEGTTSSQCLDIFVAIADSAAFYQFVRDKQFYGQRGQAMFFQQYDLITAQLQHEEYDEQVLNHLLAAFKVISPFMDAKKNFKELMKEVTTLNVVSGVKHLETVNTNITLIRLWFSRAEGDTIENVAQELECIIKTGTYTFQLGGADEMSSEKNQMILEYEPAALSHDQLPPGSLNFQRCLTRNVSHSKFKKPCRERRNLEQIGDFVRKLGFMDKDKEKEGGDNIKRFLHLNQTVHKLFELYLKLKELGHPSYLHEDIPYSKLMEEADVMVQNTQQAVTEGSQQISELRNRYTWLLYFNIPRMLKLYQMIQSIAPKASTREMVDEIVNEISFLAVNEPAMIEKLRKGVKHAQANTVLNAQSPPMQQVGEFLNVAL